MKPHTRGYPKRSEQRLRSPILPTKPARQRHGKITAHVSDHALVRYLERAMHFSRADLEAKMLGHGVKQAIELGARKVVIDGIQYVVGKNGCVITVLEKWMHVDKGLRD